MALVKLDSQTSNSYNRAVDVTYVYEVTTYLDTETNEKTKKRKVIGKLDPETGEMVPTRKKGASKSEVSDGGAEYRQMYEQAVEESRNQMEYERSVRENLTAALQRSSRLMKDFIRQAETELKEIDRLLELLGEKPRS